MNENEENLAAVSRDLRFGAAGKEPTGQEKPAPYEIERFSDLRTKTEFIRDGERRVGIIIYVSRSNLTLSGTAPLRKSQFHLHFPI